MSQKLCHECRGKGKMLYDSDSYEDCGTCKGERFVQPPPAVHHLVGNPHDIGREIMERIAKVHPWKEQCVADIAAAITSERDAVTLRKAQLRYISTQWPETSAGKYARAALDQSAFPQTKPECEECHGTSEVFVHADDCHDDLCALNGDIHSCAGKVEPCGCTPSPRTKMVAGDAMLNISKFAGQHDIRYPTNAAMQAFIGSILSDFQAEWEKRKDPALFGIAEEMKESGGHWQPCTGCYDTEDGHPTQKYDYSPALQTAIGCGCNECGGLGAVWWHMTEAELASYAEDMEAIDDDAIDAIQRLMNKKGLTRKDLFPAKSRASECMSRKRPLSMAMIRKLHFEHGIPAQVLIAPYRAALASTEGAEG